MGMENGEIIPGAQYLAIDLETTGLSVEDDTIIEAAWCLLDERFEQLTPIKTRVRRWSPWIFERLIMNSFVREMHEESGLLELFAAGTIQSRYLSEIEQEIIDTLRRVSTDVRPVLFGSSVHFDHGFIDREMPALSAMIHYRNADLTSMAALMKARGWVEPERVKIAHRAADDILWSITRAQELRDWEPTRSPSGR